MKLPISWLRDWIAVEGSPERIAEALTTRGFYVEGVETHGRRYPGIVVGHVLEAEKHPNADKLKLCRVDGGSGELRVVCGAPNVTAGMRVPLATVGTTMPNGLLIKQAKIRGEESQGMLCSARELLLSDDHEGILDLRTWLPDAALVTGRPIDAYLPEPDAVLEVEVPFNRPDGMGIIGLAREVKAALGGRWTPQAEERLSSRTVAGGTFDLEVESAEECPRFFAQEISGIAIGPSPSWLVRRLEALGARSINNVVDLTNLVLFEFGQPMHAYDLDRLQGPALRVRRAKAGESLVTLDGKARELTPDLMVIADRTRPVGIAGVMGGADSEVTGATTRLLLECATFQPARVRRAAKALGLSTEASKRYERGVDPAIGSAAAMRFITLLLELFPQATLGASQRRGTESAPRTLSLRASRCTRLIGLPFTAERCAQLLDGLEFDVQPGDPLVVTIPSWRVDVTLEDDLVEEVARANGYDRIPEAPLETGGTFARRSPHEVAVRRARECMLARGLHEAWSSTLISEREASAAVGLLGGRDEQLVRLRNPMSREGEVLRPNLVPGLLRAVSHNLKQGAEAVRLFEVGAGITARPGERLPLETGQIAAVVCGPRWAHAHDAAQAVVDFFDAKGLWEAWLREMRVDAPEWRAYAGSGWKLGASAEVADGPSCIAWAGTLAQPFLRTWDIEVPVQLFVAHLDPLSARQTEAPRARVPGRFPPVRRDLAFFVARTVSHARIERSLAASGGDWLRSIELFDHYEGPGTPEGSKSLAYALQFQHPERTLTEAEVTAIQERMVAAVARDCDGRLRER